MGETLPLEMLHTGLVLTVDDAWTEPRQTTLGVLYELTVETRCSGMLLTGPTISKAVAEPIAPSALPCPIEREIFSVSVPPGVHLWCSSRLLGVVLASFISVLRS